MGDALRERLGGLIGFEIVESSVLAEDEQPRTGFVEQRVRFRGRDGDVPAFLLLPQGTGPFPGVVIFHQHNSQWHWGKSEVAGHAGDRLQAFGPALARSGVAVLAPDAVGFEDRRRSGPGTEPRQDDGLQYLNEMAYRLVRGELLARTVLSDASAALSALTAHDSIDAKRVGVLGHSYGGNIALLIAALDHRPQFVCASGTAASFHQRIKDGTGLEFMHVIPGVLEVADLEEIIGLIAPRPLLLLSATEDPYSSDAPAVMHAAAAPWVARGAPHAIEHVRYQGGHALTAERVECIIAWLRKHGRARN